MLVGKHWVPLKTWNNIGIEEQKKKKGISILTNYKFLLAASSL